MRTYYFLSLAFAVSLLVAANVQAEMITLKGITSYGTTDIEAYFAASEGHSDWTFGEFYNKKEINNQGNKSEHWQFDITNEKLGQTVYGTLTASGMNGWADGFNFHSTNSSGTVDISHNTAMVASMSFNLSGFTDSFLDSFYFTLKAHDNSHDSWVYVTAKDSNGEVAQFKQQAIAGMFFGFTVEEGYFTEFIITIADASGNVKNNGGFESLFIGLGDWGKDGFVPPPSTGGDGDMNVSNTATPEPATLLILGLGLAGAGVAARRRGK